MDDIFQKAIAGDTNAVKGLYACSVESAYAALFAVTGEEPSAVEMVKEIYLWAFSGAKNYEDFFAVLNARANKACKVLIDKSAALAPIAPTASVFADIEAMDLPAELKAFPEALCAIVLKRQQEQEQKPSKQRFKLGKKEAEKPKSELEEFEELVKKREFSAISDSYAAPQPEEVEQPKTIAEKMQPEEAVVTDEQIIRNRLEMEKSKKASFIAIIFAGIILLGALATYIITTQFGDFKTIVQKPTDPITTTAPAPVYHEGDEEQAFEDYFQQVILKQSPRCSYERIVAYDISESVGIDQITGVLSRKTIDIDGDGIKEFFVIRSVVEQEGVIYRFSMLMDLYRFEDMKVKAAEQGYNLIEYSLYNSGGENDFGNFKMNVKWVEDGTTQRLTAAASNKNMRLVAFHYFEGGTIHQAERFAYLVPVHNRVLYFQRIADGTWMPLYVQVYGKAQTAFAALDDESLKTVRDFGFNIGDSQVKYQNEATMLDYVNSLTLKLGYKLQAGFVAKATGENAQLLCSLVASSEQGDMLTRREVVQLKDYTE